MARVCVGIDLGTTYSVVAVCRKGKVDVIANDSGSRTTPSVVAFLDGEAFVGDAAKDLPAEGQLFDSKRLLGRSASDELVRKDAKEWPFTVAQEHGVLKMKVPGEGKSLEPHEVSAMVLKSLKEAAEMFLTQPVDCAVLTVPPHFTAAQRLATRRAGELAQLQVLELLDEPKAAAAAYGLAADKTVLVLHVGGRSVHAWVRPGGGGQAGRHADWGGSLFDQRLLEHVQKDILEKNRVARLSAASLAEVRAACETAKRKLSTAAEVPLSFYLSRENVKYKASVTRARFEDLCADLFLDVMKVVRGAMAAARVRAVDEVVLVGGSARVPRIRGMVREGLGVEPRLSVNPDEAVAHGAALHAAALVGDRSAAGNEVQLREEAARRPGPKMAPGGAAAASPRKIAAAVSARRSTASGAAVGAAAADDPKQGPPIGIDLGTTYSVVAVCRKGKVDVIANDSGSRTTPSVVAFLDGESFVGDAAKDLPASHRVFDAKRLLGRPWKDLDVQKDKKHWPFEVLEKNGVPRIRVKVTSDKETFAPEEISAMVLRSLKETAQNFLGGPVSRAVITVPAYFNERQRQATVDAGKIAGLEVMSIINEPTAAAIAYGLDRKSTAKRTIFIFDLGGGTFDVSVVTIQGSDFTVLASDGDTHLGGQDFDVRLMEHFLKDINSRHGISQLDMESSQELRAACELAKRKLSTQAEASTTLFFSRYNIRYSLAVTRARFEDLCGDLFRKAMDITRRVMLEAEVPFSAIDEVVLVGGSTRIPKVRAMLSELFGGKELRQSINPDEAVAHGAAVRAAVLAGDEFVSRLVQLRDVTPLSLGVSVVGDRFSVIIPRNSQIPCERTERYYTVCDYQTSISSKIYQGERRMVRDNHCLDKEYCVDVPAMPAGEAKVDVTFRLDSDGLLTVTCVEPTTGARQRLTISRAEAALGAGDVQAMVERAERLRGEDRAAEEAVLRQLRAMNLRV